VTPTKNNTFLLLGSCMAEWNEMSVNLLTSAFRQIAAFGKDPSEEEVEKVQLECVRMCMNLMLFETFQRNIFLVTWLF